MSFFTDWRSHYAVGFLLGIAMRGLSPELRSGAIQDLDRWGWRRELKQKAKSNTPDDPVSAKQQREAAAWGAGARQATGLAVPYPSPPYPEGAEWEA